VGVIAASRPFWLRIALALYAASLVLLPWAWFPPFPWLHEHAQWSDAVFAGVAVAWVLERWQLGQWPRLHPAHTALGLYFLFAFLSLLFSAPNPRVGAVKLLGVAELCTLTFITSDLASRKGVSRSIARAVAITSLVTAAAAVAGLVLFYAGVSSPLIGIYGELEPSSWYARVQAGTNNPNLLASFAIFASAIVARRDGELPAWLRRVTFAALCITVCLTFSRGILGFALAAVIRGARTPRRRVAAATFAAGCVSIIISLTVWKPSINPTNPLDIRFESVASSRYQAASSSLRTLATHPLFGSGLGTSPGQYLDFPFDAHCTPINIAATLGLPALIAFSAMLTLLWRHRRRPTDVALWSGIAGLALDALAQDIEDFRHVWVLFGLAASEPESHSAEVYVKD
jgi:O-antigen ligase/polysaccharide polymerase Wzy-like membrane protein